MVDLMHIRTSCPRCHSGIMTPHNILRIQNDTIHIKSVHDSHEPVDGEIILTTCSLDVCGYTEMLATPQILSENKKTKAEATKHALILMGGCYS